MCMSVGMRVSCLSSELGEVEYHFAAVYSYTFHFPVPPYVTAIVLENLRVRVISNRSFTTFCCPLTDMTPPTMDTIFCIAAILERGTQDNVDLFFHFRYL